MRTNAPIGWEAQSGVRWLWHGGVMYFWDPTNPRDWTPSIDRVPKSAQFDDSRVSSERALDWARIVESELKQRLPAEEELVAWAT